MIRLQLLILKFTKGLHLSDAEINTIALLAENGYYKGVYKKAVDEKYFKSEQSARNCIINAVKLGILLDRKEKYKLNPEHDISVDEFIVYEVLAHNLP